LKTLLLSTHDTLGGAAIAAFRLLRGLNDIGTKARMLVNEKHSADPNVIVLNNNRYQNAVTKLRSVVDLQPLYTLYPQRHRTAYSLNWLPDRTVRAINTFSPDIVNLHWINAGFIRLENLKKIRAPIVWTLHDMWAFTGGCHYNNHCQKFTASCGACPLLKGHRAHDLSRWIWRRKKRAWKDLKFRVVTPSRWLAERATESSLFRDRPIDVIPYALDTQIFRPIEQTIARDLLRIPQNRRIVLFGSVDPLKDPRKGFHILKGALRRLLASFDSEELGLAFFGAGPEGGNVDFGYPTYAIGRLNDGITLALAYSAADVFLAPSLQDNLPNTVMEAMACGTPCVAFNIGGMPDMIDHMKNGFLVQPFDTNEFAQGIGWLLEENARLKEQSECARQKALEAFALEIQAQRYRDLYYKMIREG